MAPTTPPSDGDRQRRVHRALSSSVRVRLLDLLRAEPDRDVAAIAERLGLHVNTVRVHLGVLEEAALVVAVREDRDRPGRPRRLYRATADHGPAAPVDPDHGYGFLARVLAGYLDATSDAARVGERAGAAWGAHLVDRPPPFTTIAPAAVVDQLVALLAEHGFAPETIDDGAGRIRLRLRRCPFLDVAREHQDLVCSLHLGLMRGALDGLGGEVRAERLTPWAEPDACVASLTGVGGGRSHRPPDGSSSEVAGPVSP
jgi:predicted ArsR family transcriptional regulator